MGSTSLGGMEFMHEMGDLPIPGIAHVGSLAPADKARRAVDRTAEAFGVH